LTALGTAALKDSITLSQLLRRPQVTLDEILTRFPSSEALSSDLRSALEIEAKFTGYLDRQEEEVRKLKKIEVEVIPTDFPYDAVKQLRIEAREKLKKHRPATIGQAMRIPGMTPSAISLLAVYLKRFRAGELERV
jgi:tRNA uridine 5-carboxymethylaminomethyl modification enzyme